MKHNNITKVTETGSSESNDQRYESLTEKNETMKKRLTLNKKLAKASAAHARDSEGEKLYDANKELTLLRVANTPEEVNRYYKKILDILFLCEIQRATGLKKILKKNYIKNRSINKVREAANHILKHECSDFHTYLKKVNATRRTAKRYNTSNFFLPRKRATAKANALYHALNTRAQEMPPRLCALALKKSATELQASIDFKSSSWLFNIIFPSSFQREGKTRCRIHLNTLQVTHNEAQKRHGQLIQTLHKKLLTILPKRDTPPPTPPQENDTPKAPAAGHQA